MIMKPTPIFLDGSVSPSDTVLRKQLGRSYAAFSLFQQLSAHLMQEWKYYNKKSGWVFKVVKKRRASFYLVPERKQVFFGMAVNEKEKQILLDEDRVDQETKQALASAEKVMEGYPIQKVVRSKKAATQLRIVLAVLDRI